LGINIDIIIVPILIYFHISNKQIVLPIYAFSSYTPILENGGITASIYVTSCTQEFFCEKLIGKRQTVKFLTMYIVVCVFVFEL